MLSGTGWFLGSPTQDQQLDSDPDGSLPAEHILWFYEMIQTKKGNDSENKWTEIIPESFALCFWMLDSKTVYS